MTTLDTWLEQLEKAEASAMSGPWLTRVGFQPDTKTLELPPRCYGYRTDWPGFHSCDAEFIALARNNMKRLIEIIRVQQVALETVAQAFYEEHGGLEALPKFMLESAVEFDTLCAKEALAKVEELLK